MAIGKSSIAYEILKNKIIYGEMPPLSDISEEALQKELKISRTPIHEAIQQLCAEGFVLIYPRKGTIVSDVTSDLLYQIHELRELNEPYIVRKVSKMVDREWLLSMKEKFSLLPSESSCAQTRMLYCEYDRELHSTILSYCSNSFLKTVMANAYDHAHRARLKTSLYSEYYTSTIAEHLNIINAMLDGNQKLIELACLEHILIARKNAHEANLR